MEYFAYNDYVIVKIRKVCLHSVGLSCGYRSNSVA